MNILSAYDTDIGVSKNVNQDALLIKGASTNQGCLHLAVLCDGMGGYSSGEVASSTLIRAFSDWFDIELPKLLQYELSLDKVREQWRELVELYSKRTVEYGLSLRPSTKLGTTLTAILITEFFGAEIIHVGDSRLYRITDTLEQLTHDQTKIGYLMSQGKIYLTEEEYEHHPERHILSQCIGGSKIGCEPQCIRLEPQAFRYESGFLLCSDGFRHEVTRSEFFDEFRLHELTDEKTMKKKIRRVIRMNIDRGETDNISAVLLKVMQ